MKWLEIPLLLAVTIVAAAADVDWPSSLSAGKLLLVLAVVFLIQTLIRDLFLYAALKRGEKSQPRREAQCFCLESGVGIVMVVLGLILFLANAGGSTILAKTEWIALLGGLLFTNFLLKDFVFSWNPWRVYRDPNHLNIIPRL